ncbi:MAG: hypothetical protein JJE04_23850 [Acidobacteriia bacterium]|nr:hypothetical protein [Terriglobia bacterium]
MCSEASATYERQVAAIRGAASPSSSMTGEMLPPEWLSEAVLEIADHSGVASYETQKLAGHFAVTVVSCPVLGKQTSLRAHLHAILKSL